MIFDPHYLMMVALPILILGMITQGMLKSAFAKYSRVRASSGLTGAEAAHEMLRSAGIADRVSIERVQGFLSDHYDSRKKVLRLSPEIYGGTSLAAVGVACHEAGHAVQDARNYVPLVLRNAIVPTASIGSGAGLWMVIIGLFLQWQSLALLGLLLFGMVVVFQLVNLPVEFNASSRAKQMVTELGIVHGPAEAAGVAKVLNAAAMTYVGAAIGAILQLLYFISLFSGRRN